MELGHFHLQLIMSVTLILTAAIVAFICDVLKHNNEQLREMNIELQIRQEREQKRWAIPAPQITKWEPEAEKIAQPRAHMASKKDRSAVSKEKKRAVNPEALAVMERGAALARSAPSAAVRESKPTSIRKDWESLLNRNAQTAKVTPTPNSLPSGFHLGLEAGLEDGYILSKLIQSRQPVSGLVVSIGVDASSKTKGKLAGDVRKLVESLIGPNDFAAQSGEDEFLLIYPQEHGASAQRRLSQVARQLWDFQLRSLGSLEILFSWGGVEVRSESIEEAIASASERMQETKRGRKLLTPVNELRKAV
jgi:GGDEF domain-containing protein